MYNNLTRFDEGGTHEQNKLGGILQGQDNQGNMNTVEQGESKKGNFVYSNRITLDKELVKQFNLPGYIANKSVADASKAIDNKFKDRQDKYALETKQTLLDRLAEAQEHLKVQEQAQFEQANQSMRSNSQEVPDMMNGEVPQGMEEYSQQEQVPQQISQGLNPASPIAAFGGYQVKKYQDGGYVQGDNNLDGIINNSDNIDKFGNPLKSTGIPNIAGSLGALGTVVDLGKTAFGRPVQDTGGLSESAKVDSLGMIGGSALKGASAGMAFGPWGALIGGVVGGGAGLLGSQKAKKAASQNTTNFASNVNRQFSDQYALGGNLKYQNGGLLEDPIDPTKFVTSTTGISDAPVHRNLAFNTKKIVRYQPGVSNDKMGSGFYLYSKNVTDPGFNVDRDREFIKQSEMMAVQRTPEWKEYMTQQALNKAQNKFANGGMIDPPSYTIPQLQQTIGLQPGKWGSKSKEALMNWQKQNNLTPDGLYGPSIFKKAGLMNDSGQYRFKKPEIGDTSNEEITLPSSLPENEIKPTATLDSLNKYYSERNPLTLGNPNKTIGDIAKTAGKQSLNFANQNIGEAIRYSPILTNALQLKNLKKPTGVQYNTLDSRFKPEYVDEASLRNIVDQEGNNQINALTQSGASQGAVRAAILGAGLNKTKALSDAYINASAQNRASNVQAQMFNRENDLQNINVRNRAIDEGRMDDAAYRSAKSKLISTLGTDLGSVGKEIADAQLAGALTGYTRKGKYLYKPDGTRVTPEELAKTRYMTQSPTPSLKKGDQYIDENGKTQVLKYGGYLNYKKR